MGLENWNALSKSSLDTSSCEPLVESKGKASAKLQVQTSTNPQRKWVFPSFLEGVTRGVPGIHMHFYKLVAKPGLMVCPPVVSR